MGESSRSLEEAYLRCRGRERGSIGHLYRRFADPPLGPGYAEGGDNESIE